MFFLRSFSCFGIICRIASGSRKAGLLLNRLMKKALIVLLLLCAPGGVCASASATAAVSRVTLSYRLYLAQDDAKAASFPSEKPADWITFFSPVGDRNYAFVLPANWDAQNLRLYMTGTQSVSIGGKTYQNGDKISLPLGRGMDVAVSQNPKIRLTVSKTGGLPSLYISTQSGSVRKLHESKTYSEPATLLMLDADGNVFYEGDLSAIRIRGNSTTKYAKKPYQIKLKEGFPLLGTSKDKTYILLANTLDRSQIRNTLALAMARYSGAYAFVPAAQSVDLYLNNDYKGTYLLTEKVEIDKDRLNITNLEKATKQLNPNLDFDVLRVKGTKEYNAKSQKLYYKAFDLPSEPEDYTGGFLLQTNLSIRYATELSGFVTKRGLTFTMQEPKYTTLTQMKYLSSLFQQIENALYSENGVDAASGKHYTQLIDLHSFVNKYVMAEVLDDFDGQRCYFHKDSDAVDPKVYVGPVWDQDNILGASTKQSDPTAIRLASDRSGYYWFTRAAKQKDFAAAARKTYRQVYRPAIQILLGNETDPTGTLLSIDQYAFQVRASANADLLRWPNSVRNAYPNFNAKTGNDFSAQVEYLKRYLTQRLPALDKAFPDDEAQADPVPSQAFSPADTSDETPTPRPVLATHAPAPTPTPRPAVATPAPEDMYTLYKSKTQHIGVYPLRLRLYQLGYLEKLKAVSNKAAYEYDSAMMNAVKLLQEANDLPVDGIATPELQAFIYSDDCLPVPGARKTATPKPDLMQNAQGPTSKPPMPDLDGEGFLPQGSEEEFLYQDDAGDGLWYYISSDLYVEIRKYVQTAPKKLVWFETHVRLRNDLMPDCIFSKGKEGSVKEEHPEKIARRGRAVLAITDDFYGYRVARGYNAGLIIRNGKLLVNKVPKSASITLFPRTDEMAFLPDGTMAVWERGRITAKELQAMGVQNSYSFGPPLISGGQETVLARYSPAALHTEGNPRNGIGMLDKNDFVILTVRGRAKDSDGVGVDWLLDRFLEIGVQTAFNLDGGGTSCLVFMGHILDKNPVSARFVNSMMRFGTSELTEPK